MSESTTLLRPSDPAWDEWLQRVPHDFYFRAGYHAFAEKMGEGKAFMVVHGTKDRFVAWPYLVCSIDDDHVDANSVYGYTGPIGKGLDDAGFRQEAWDAICKVWKEQRLVTVFTRFHPILENSDFCDGLKSNLATPGGVRFLVGRTVSIDLQLDREQRRRSYRKILRQEIQSAERAGLVLEHDHDWNYLPQLGELYRSTMQRNEASERYQFSDDYLASLRDALGDTGHLAAVHMRGVPAAILLFTVCGEVAQAHLTGVNANFQKLSPLKVLLDGVADISRSMGARSFHLGAGRGGYEDSLFTFKSRFSPIRHNFELGRWIIDQQAHDELLVTAAGKGQHLAGYFPAYRAPVTSDSPS